jgi:hypothetical protein
VGALAHYLEEAGLATTQISLVRPHTERIRPPRALWVSFELGRPFGAPGDPAFQRRVIGMALGLLERKDGPVLEDFPEDAPASADTGDGSGWVCPVALGAPAGADAAPGSMAEAVAAEMHQLRPWYDIGLKARNGRTTVGLSRIEITDLAMFITEFLERPWPENPREDVQLVDTLKYATEDLKSFYLEAAAAQPGRQADSAALENWFWDETTASTVLFALRPILMESGDEYAAKIGDRTLIPAAQRERKAAALQFSDAAADESSRQLP